MLGQSSTQPLGNLGTQGTLISRLCHIVFYDQVEKRNTFLICGRDWWKSFLVCFIFYIIYSSIFSSGNLFRSLVRVTTAFLRVLFMNFALFVLHIFVFSKHAHLGLILNRIYYKYFYRSSRLEVFCRKGVLRNVPKFTGKHRCNFIKKEILAQVFSREFCEISKNTFFHITPPVAASIFISMLQNFSEKLFSSIPLACSFWRLLDIQGFLFLHFKIMIRTLEVCQFLLCLKAEIRHHFKMIISKWSY